MVSGVCSARYFHGIRNGPMLLLKLVTIYPTRRNSSPGWCSPFGYPSRPTQCPSQLTTRVAPVPRKGGSMFVELMPLLAGRTVLITVAKVDDKTLRVNVIPHGKADDNPALSTPHL